MVGLFLQPNTEIQRLKISYKNHERMLEPIVNYLQTIGSIYIEAKLNKELPDVLQKKPEPPYEGSYTRYKSYSIHLQRGQIALTHPTLVFLSDA